MTPEERKKLIKSIKSQLRLNTPSPKLEMPKTTYNRKKKHKKDEEYKDAY
jgi:hypothetical protein